MRKWKRVGDKAIGMDENGKELVNVPFKEPVHIRPAYDKLYQITPALIVREEVFICDP